MKLISLTQLIDYSMRFVINTSNMCRIDESHALSHSIDVFSYANMIYKSEVKKFPELCEKQDVIYLSAILHDMCDDKYMDIDDGIKNIEGFLKNYVDDTKISAVKDIITTMSYSKVKKYGFPTLGENQLAYHIVRESDLLTAYDFKRSVVYNMFNTDDRYSESILCADKLFESRVLRHFEHGLFITDTGKEIAKKLHEATIQDINSGRYFF